MSANPSTEQLSTKVVLAVADAKNVDPLDLPPLYYAIDPDVLDQLFQSRCRTRASGTATVRFTFAGCDVVVASGNQVTVTLTDSDTERDIEA